MTRPKVFKPNSEMEMAAVTSCDLVAGRSKAVLKHAQSKRWREVRCGLASAMRLDCGRLIAAVSRPHPTRSTANIRREGSPTSGFGFKIARLSRWRTLRQNGWGGQSAARRTRGLTRDGAHGVTRPIQILYDLDDPENHTPPKRRCRLAYSSSAAKNCGRLKSGQSVGVTTSSA